MASFSDGNGHTYEIVLGGLGSVKKIRKATGITICNIYDAKTQAALSSDFEEMADVVWVLIQPQAAEKKVTKEQFENQVHGKVLEDMREALRAEVSDFLPQQERDAFEMSTLLDQTNSLPKDIREILMDGLKEPLQDQLRTSMESAGESEEGSESTPAV